jgi:hypothetical protein
MPTTTQHSAPNPLNPTHGRKGPQIKYLKCERTNPILRVATIAARFCVSNYYEEFTVRTGWLSPQKRTHFFAAGYRGNSPISVRCDEHRWREAYWSRLKSGHCEEGLLRRDVAISPGLRFVEGKGKRDRDARNGLAMTNLVAAHLKNDKPNPFRHTANSSQLSLEQSYTKKNLSHPKWLCPQNQTHFLASIADRVIARSDFLDATSQSLLGFVLVESQEKRDRDARGGLAMTRLVIPSEAMSGEYRKEKKLYAGRTAHATGQTRSHR